MQFVHKAEMRDLPVSFSATRTSDDEFTIAPTHSGRTVSKGALLISLSMATIKKKDDINTDQWTSSVCGVNLRIMILIAESLMCDSDNFFSSPL